MKEVVTKKHLSCFPLPPSIPSFLSWLPSSWGSPLRWPHLLLPLLLPLHLSLLDAGFQNHYFPLDSSQGPMSVQSHALLR